MFRNYQLTTGHFLLVWRPLSAFSGHLVNTEVCVKMEVVTAA